MPKFTLQTIKVVIGLSSAMFLGSAYPNSGSTDFLNRVNTATQEHQTCLRNSENYKKTQLESCKNRANLVSRANCENNTKREFRRLTGVCGDTFTRRIQNKN